MVACSTARDELMGLTRLIAMGEQVITVIC